MVLEIIILCIQFLLFFSAFVCGVIALLLVFWGDNFRNYCTEKRINKLCKILDCQPSDIIYYIPDEEYQKKVLNLNRKGIKAVKDELHKCIQEDKKDLK